MASYTSIALATILLISYTCLAAATVYTVGDTSGWTSGYDYSTWASNKTFAVGDSLVFNYVGSSHTVNDTVNEVTSSDYASCSTSNSISSDSNGPTTITVKTVGTHYFICGVPGHCSNGMKLAVSVGSSGDSTPTTPSISTPSTMNGGSGTHSGAMAKVASPVMVVVGALFVMLV